jgi:acid phosphatase type 7
MRRARGDRRWSRRLTITLSVAVFAVLAGAGTVLADQGGWLFFSGDNAWPYNNPGPAPVLAAVGDISCQPTAPQGTEKPTDVCTGGATATTRNAAQNATAEQVEAMHPALIAILGDEQYQNGYYSDFENSFDKYWGALKFLQRPAPGNHEFYDNHGQPGVRGLGYFDYYNGIQHSSDGSEDDVTVTNPTTGAPVTNGDGSDVTQPKPQPSGQAGSFGTTGDGWYSYNLGDWHLISLNIECSDEPGGCSATGSWFQSETQWLEQDLSQDRSECTIAYWHQPTFSSTASPFTSDSAEGQTADAWWKLLYQHRATLILNGHDHVYSRFAPMDPAGNVDQRHGIREFIIGTGGEALDTVLPDTPNLQAWADQYYGTMKFTLGPGWYKWDYESAMENPAAPAGTPPTYSDTGTGVCNGPSGIHVR